MTISFNNILEKLDEHLRQQLKEYKYSPEINPIEPVNMPKPKRKRLKKDVLGMKKSDRSTVKAAGTEITK